MISTAQMKAARALLDWQQEKLAEKCGLSVATIRKIETRLISPRKTTADQIQKTFEAAGLEFIEPDGVRRRPEEVAVFEGVDGLKKFFDDVYQTAAVSSLDQIVMVYPSVRPFIENLGTYHSARMNKLARADKIRCILTEDMDRATFVDYCEYRVVSKHYVDSVPFYVYGDKCAIILFDAEPQLKITVMSSIPMARAFRKQFESMWEKASPVRR